MSDDKWIQKANKRMKRKGTVGKFTEYCGGKVTDSCIDRAMRSNDPKLVRQANFARNVRKQDGGFLDKILSVAGTNRAGVEDKFMDMRGQIGDGQIKDALKDGIKGLKPSMGTIVNLGAQALAKRAENKAGAVSMADPFRDNVMERKASKRAGFGVGFKAASDSKVGQALGKVPVFGKVLQAGAGLVGGLVGGKKAEKQKEKDRKEAVKQLRTTQQAQLAQQAAQSKQFETSGESGFADVGASRTNSYLAQRGMKNGGERLPGGRTEPLPGGAVEFIGQKHSEGGIMLDERTEVEGGETMDKVNMKKQGGKAKDYIFSDYLKLGGKTFAQRHKELLHGGATQKEVQQLAKMQEKKAGRTPKVMQFGGIKQYQEGGENEGRNVLTMGMFSGPQNEEGQRTGDYVGSTSIVTETPGERVVQGEEGSALRRDEVEAWSQDRKQERTGDNLFAGVTEDKVEERIGEEAWFNPQDSRFGEGGFDVHNPEHVEMYQEDYNSRVPANQAIEVDGKWGEQTQSAHIPSKQSPERNVETVESNKVEKVTVGDGEEGDKELVGDEPVVEDIEDIKTKEIPTLATLGAAAQLIPPIYAFKTQPAYISGPGAASVVAPNMPRVNYNAERSANANDFRTVQAAIENSGGGPASMVNMLVGLEKKNAADRKIASAESRANTQLAGQEKMMKMRASETNARLGLQAGQFAASLSREQIRDRREEKLGALDAMADRLAGFAGDALDYKAQERLGKVIGADGIYEAQQLRDMGYTEDQINAYFARKNKQEEGQQDQENNVKTAANEASATVSKNKAEKPERGRRVGKRKAKRILADEAAQAAGFKNAKDREQQRKDFEKTRRRAERKDEKQHGGYIRRAKALKNKR